LLGNGLKGMGIEDVRSFIIKYSTAYIIVIFIYLGLAVRYSIYLWNFDCDGFGCLSILFFTGPLTMVFVISFSWVTFRWLKMKLARGQKDKDEQLIKFERVVDNSLLLITLFTFLLIIRLNSEVSS
jgi:hypothetical protein